MNFLNSICKNSIRYKSIIYYPDKRETHKVAIIPDIEIKPIFKVIQEGKDEVLDSAVKFI